MKDEKGKKKKKNKYSLQMIFLFKDTHFAEIQITLSRSYIINVVIPWLAV